MVSVDCMSFIFPPSTGDAICQWVCFQGKLSFLLNKKMFSLALVQSPLSLQFHILKLPFCSLKIRNITVSDKPLCRSLWKAQDHPTDGVSIIAVRMKDYLKKFGLNVGCGERLWDRGWCCRKVLFMAFSLILFWSYWDELCVLLCSKAAGHLLGAFVQWGFVLD